ncbi:MAG: hypothetical protein RSG52_01720 [Terrisporobacter sp.]|uniref:hypothetical protein n=1 Tax=Terrisporobacter sp. TaxID=1965305 RepID=UPI002FCB7805
MIFINKRFVVKYVEEENKMEDYIYNFSVDIKDFDTPFVNIKYDSNKNKIVSMWLNTEVDDNGPKNHVAMKLLEFGKYEVCEIIKFMVSHS